MTPLFAKDALVVPFEQLRMTDVDAVGGKNASLGEMISQLPSGVRVPTGFATTAHAFREFLNFEGLTGRINALLDALDTDDVRALATVGAQIRALVEAQPFPADLETAIRDEFARFSAGNPAASFAVRSSATAEDLPDASFAGQQETFLNVVGIEDVLHKMKEVFASLYNDRAISYRVHKGFAHADVACLRVCSAWSAPIWARPGSCSPSTPNQVLKKWSSSPPATAWVRRWCRAR
jgi:pyruvate,water dikinase